MLIFLQFSMAEWMPVTPIQALQPTSADTEVDIETPARRSTQQNKKKKVTLCMGPAGRGKNLLVLETCHKSNRL
jgi:hypothetical protein